MEVMGLVNLQKNIETNPVADKTPRWLRERYHPQ